MELHGNTPPDVLLLLTLFTRRTCKRILLVGNLSPRRSFFIIHWNPFLPLLRNIGFSKDRLDWTFRNACTTIYAFVGMNVQHPIIFIETINGTNFDTIGKFTVKAGFTYNVRHAVSF